MGYDLNSDVIRHIQHLPVSFLKKQNMAYLNQRVNNDSNQVITFCINIVQGILINSLKLLMDAWAMHVQQTLLRCQDRFQIMITNK